MSIESYNRELAEAERHIRQAIVEAQVEGAVAAYHHLAACLISLQWAMGRDIA